MSKKKLFDALKARFEDEIPEVWFGGIYNNQFESEAKIKAHKWPAAYFEFSQILWTAGIGSNAKVQQGDVDVTLYIGFKTIEDTPETFLDIIDLVYKKVEGFASNGDFDPMRRTREQQTNEFDNVFVWQITFRTNLKDEGAMNAGSTVWLADDITITRDLEIDNQILRTGKID
jgi:hypothetical protein